MTFVILNGVVGTATTLRAGWGGVRTPVRGRNFSVNQNFETGSGAHPKPILFKTYRCSLLELKSEVNHSLPTSDEFKNERSSTSTPPIWLHGVNREKCTFLLLKEPVCFL